MKIWAVSDIHIDYAENRAWLTSLSLQDYQHDCLILAGDISHRLEYVELAFSTLAQRFKQVCFVVGNHDLWSSKKNPEFNDSLHKRSGIEALAQQYNIATSAVYLSTDTAQVKILPLSSWYDYSFAPLNHYLLARWADFSACRWPATFYESIVEDHANSFLNEPQNQLKLHQQSVLDQRLCEYFLSENHDIVARHSLAQTSSLNDNPVVDVISFSHFMPRIDVMPDYIPAVHQQVYPVLGSLLLDEQIRQLGSHLHIYGHSHVNRDELIDGVRYVNNAFAAPTEKRIARKELLCVWEG